MAVSTSDNGAMENIYSANDNATIFAGYGLTNAFCAMADALKTPAVLICPSDIARTATTNFAGLTSYSNLSYFVCGDAANKYPKMILTGDRNIAKDTTVPAVPAGTEPAPSMNTINNGYSTGTIGYGTALTKSLPWVWTANDLHQACGNISLTDGSVQETALSDFVIYLSDAANNLPNEVPRFIICLDQNAPSQPESFCHLINKQT